MPRLRLVPAAILAVGLGFGSVHAADTELDQLLEDSLPLRQALHYDPTLETPLERLVDSFSQADLTQDLVTIYRDHCAAYPTDPSGRTVLIRILHAIGAPEVGAATRQAIQDFPEHAYLHRLGFLVLQRLEGEAALDMLVRAVVLTDSPIQIKEWASDVIVQALSLGRDELVDTHLQAILAAAGDAPAGLLEAAEVMVEHDRDEMALQALERALSGTEDAELAITIDLAAADAEQRLGRQSAAGQRLDGILNRLTADYWRRPEILERRLDLASDADERDAMITSARERCEQRPADEAAALDLGRMLWGFDRRRAAIDALIAASTRIPGSQALERETLAYLERLRDERGRVAFLERRLELSPERQDLAWELVDGLMRQDRLSDGLELAERVLADLDDDERGGRWLDLGRNQQRAGRLRAAAESFARATQALPLRLDARREHAEVLVELGRRGAARRVLVAPVPAEAAQEHLLDLVQFMMSQRMLNQAALVLQERMQQEPRNLEVRLRLIRVFAKLAAGRQGSLVQQEARALADTAARYRRWLEAALTLSEELGNTEDLLRAEQDRLAQEEQRWSERGIERLHVLVTVAESRFPDIAATIIERSLTDSPPEAAAQALRERLVDVQINLDDPPENLAQSLEALLAAGHHDAERYRAQLAVLYHQEGRHDRTAALLREVDSRGIEDPELLRRLAPLFAEYDLLRPQRRILERLIALEPENRDHWQHWLSALARSGSEAQLQRAIRRLLAGVDDLPITDDTADFLRVHLIDSAWRSLAQRLASGDSTDLQRALEDLTVLEHQVRDDMDGLWVVAARCLVLGQLDDAVALEGEITELERRVREQLATSDQPIHDLDLGGVRLRFPDGLAIGVKELGRILRGGRLQHQALGADPVGPEGDLALAWEVELEAELAGLADPGNGLVVAADRSGVLTAFDALSGKVRWRLPGAVAVITDPNANLYHRGRGYYHHQEFTTTCVPPVGDRNGHVVVVGSRDGRYEVVCYAATDGSLVWRAPLTATRASVTPTAPISLHIDNGRIITFDGQAMRAQARRIDDGRLIWDRQLESGVGPSAQVSGASVGDGLVVVYATQTAVLDAETGELLWAFDPQGLNEFPIQLEDPERLSRANANRGAPAMPTPAHGRHSGGPYGQVLPPVPTTSVIAPGINHNGSARVVGNFALGNAAAAWSQQGHDFHQSARSAVVAAGKLTLISHHGLLSLDLGLPLKPVEGWFHGTIIGTAAGTVIGLNPDALRLYDPATGNDKIIELASIAGGQQDMVSATVDGPRVYVAGPRGMKVINARSGTLLATASWPASNDLQALGLNSLAYQFNQAIGYRNNGHNLQLNVHGQTASGAFIAPLSPTRLIAVARASDLAVSPPDNE